MSDNADSEAKTCVDCGGEMHKGFVPDGQSGIAVVQPRWVTGKPEGHWLTVTKMPKDSPYLVTAWRCEDCGVLKSYAHKKQWRHVTD